MSDFDKEDVLNDYANLHNHDGRLSVYADQDFLELSDLVEVNDFIKELFIKYNLDGFNDEFVDDVCLFECIEADNFYELDLFLKSILLS